MIKFEILFVFVFGIILLHCAYEYEISEVKISRFYSTLHPNSNESIESLREAFSIIETKTLKRKDFSVILLNISVQIGSKITKDHLTIRENELKSIDFAGKSVSRYSPMSARAWCTLAMTSLYLHGVDKTMIERIRACYKLGPYEDELVGARLALVFSVWDHLPENLHNTAVSEIEERLSKTATRQATIRHLASTIATIAPKQQELAETLLLSKGDESVKYFIQLLRQHSQ